MWRVSLICCVVATALLAMPAAPVEPRQPAVVDGLPPQPEPKAECSLPHSGRVVGVTDRTITLQCLDLIVANPERCVTGRTHSIHVGKDVRFCQWKTPGGLTATVATGQAVIVSREDVHVISLDGRITVLNRSAQPPRKFELSNQLASGGDARDRGECYAYKASDVRIGDEVDVVGEFVDGKWRCAAIRITRRSGGQVPPSQLAHTTKRPWHFTANAWQAWEEHGIPLPEFNPPPHAKPRSVPSTIPPAKD